MALYREQVESASAALAMDAADWYQSLWARLGETVERPSDERIAAMYRNALPGFESQQVLEEAACDVFAADNAVARWRDVPHLRPWAYLAIEIARYGINGRPLATGTPVTPNPEPRSTPAFPKGHRQLKLASAFTGITVQDLVERAIQEFLTKHPELHPSLGPSRSLKSTPRKPR